jgi:ATP-binding cassette subfamily B protein
VTSASSAGSSPIFGNSAAACCWRSPSSIAAKLANISVPLVMKRIVDGPLRARGDGRASGDAARAYGLLRLSSTVFNELRDVVFVKVAQRAMRRVALEVFHHLHALSLRFHLERQTGGLTRDIERGTRGISTLLSFMVFSVLPTLLEMALVTGLPRLAVRHLVRRDHRGRDRALRGAHVLDLEWRTEAPPHHERGDSKANTAAIDSLLNYETVKYFGNESYEAARYDENLQRYEHAVVTSESSLGLPELRAGAGDRGRGVAPHVARLRGYRRRRPHAGRPGDGERAPDPALHPLNFLGVMYREIKQALVDMEKMFRLLGENREVQDKPGAPPLAGRRGAMRFENVDFSYDGVRPILHDVSFEVPAGHKVAVVGASGSGKSTLARLLFRFYDVNRGRITIDGQDIRDGDPGERALAIGVVPQDTVLFNDTIYYNIAYGPPERHARGGRARRARGAHRGVHRVAAAEVGDNVASAGLKLSGGEKQRVSIARTLLKQPPILVFDEATSRSTRTPRSPIQASSSRSRATTRRS